jgi:hypothetical protein
MLGHPPGEPHDRSPGFRQSGRVGGHSPYPAARSDLDTILTSVAVESPGHDGPMKQRGKASSRRRRGTQGTMVAKRAADDRALALLPTIRKLVTAGFASDLGLANELNRRGITGALGGRWHRSSVRRLLARLRQLTLRHGRINDDLAMKRAADVRAEPYSPTIRRLRKAGFVSGKAIAQELNARGIPTAGGSKWHPTTVTRLLRRLDRLDRVSRSRR